MAMAEFCRAEEVPPGAVLVLHLSEPSVDQPIGFSFLASSPSFLFSCMKAADVIYLRVCGWILRRYH
jgi:hypothetical protein